MEALVLNTLPERVLVSSNSSQIMDGGVWASTADTFVSANAFWVVMSNIDIYNLDMVEEIARAMLEPRADAPAGEREFLEWLHNE